MLYFPNLFLFSFLQFSFFLLHFSTKLLQHFRNEGNWTKLTFAKISGTVTRCTPVTIPETIAGRISAPVLFSFLKWPTINRAYLINLGFLDDLNSKQAVLQWVNHNHHIRKLSVYDAVPVISVMLWPHDVNLIVAKVTDLRKQQYRKLDWGIYWSISTRTATGADKHDIGTGSVHLV